MDTEEIIKRLRQPAAKVQPKTTDLSKGNYSSAQLNQPTSGRQNPLIIIALVVIFVASALTIFSVMGAKNRAENVSEELDPSQVEGLVVQRDFTPSAEVTYVQITEGEDRNVAVSNLGTTLPIISRFNYKAMTPANFQLIGTAPWALTTNVSANLDDPDVLRFLLANDNMIQAFLIRPDAADLLDDPQNLADFVKDTGAMKEFFEDETTKQVLENPAIIKTLSNSRFMSFLLISTSAKYFRTHPQEAADLIASSPYLQQLQANANVAQAVRENRYLAKIADVLLTPRAPAVKPEQPAQQNNTQKAGKKQKKS